MDKRYQVFLSSTYEDLKEERLEVMKAILELDCFPVGMEYFPAADEDQWTFIANLIDQCDYYIVVLGSRYGSVDEKGIGFTQKEYEYAIEKGIPVIAFTHSDPELRSQKLSEKTDHGKNKFENFRKLLQTRLCKKWSNTYELGAVVSRSLSQLIRNKPRTGWVRADQVASQESYKEIIRLKNLVEKQEILLSRLKEESSQGTEKWAQGEDMFKISFKVTLTDENKSWKDDSRSERLSSHSEHTWDEIFASFASYLLIESKESEIKRGVTNLIKDANQLKLTSKKPNIRLGPFTVNAHTMNVIITQFITLRLIMPSSQVIDDKHVRCYTLTELGKRKLTEELAIKRSNT